MVEISIKTRTLEEREGAIGIHLILLVEKLPKLALFTPPVGQNSAAAVDLVRLMHGIKSFQKLEPVNDGRIVWAYAPGPLKVSNVAQPT